MSQNFAKKEIDRLVFFLSNLKPGSIVYITIAPLNQW